MANSDKYLEMYRQAIDDLSAAVDERTSLEERLEQVRSGITKFRQVATSVSALLSRDPRAEHPDLFVDVQQLDYGITERVRGCFKPHTELSAIQVRGALEASKFDLTDYKNVLATIHTILKRLVKAGELFVMESGEQGNATTYMKPSIKSVAVAKEVTKILKERRPAWATYLNDYGGLILGDPPFFASGRKCSVRQKREVSEALAEVAAKNNVAPDFWKEES